MEEIIPKELKKKVGNEALELERNILNTRNGLSFVTKTCDLRSMFDMFGTLDSETDAFREHIGYLFGKGQIRGNEFMAICGNIEKFEDSTIHELIKLLREKCGCRL